MSPKRLPIVSGARVVRALKKLRRGPRTVIVLLHNEVRPGTLASILRGAGMSAGRLRELL